MGRVNSYGMIAFVIAPIVGGLIIGDAQVENLSPPSRSLSSPCSLVCLFV